MRIAIKASAIALAAFVSVSAVGAADMPTPEDTYRDIEATYGFVPGFMQAYPKTAISGAWAMTKGLNHDPGNALEPKVKSLINLAVAAQIPCQYCIWIETKMARTHGATDQEIAEAVGQAAFTRHWSTVLNGLQIDFATFQSEFGGN